MKTAIKFLALSLVLVMTLTMLSSCGLFSSKPAKDPKDAKSALKDNDYKVEVVKDEEEALEVAASLATYAPRTWDMTDELEDLSDDLYDAYEEIGEIFDYELDVLDDFDRLVAAIHEDDEEAIAIFYFEEKDTAKELYEDYFEETFEIVTDLASELDIELVYGISGAMFWIGTEQAVKDAK